MRIGIGVGVVVLAKALVAQAALIPVLQSDFLPGAQVVTFETGTTGLPPVPGLTFLSTGPSSSSSWYGSSGNFSGFFGRQGWSNTHSSTYGDLGAQFSPTVQAVGGYVGRIPNAHQHPSQVSVELFNSSLVSLGTTSISLPPAFNSPVFFGFRAEEPIARFGMTGNNTGFFSVDDFTFGSVPEPASPMVALAGMAILQTRRSRRCNARSSMNRLQSVRG